MHVNTRRSGGTWMTSRDLTLRHPFTRIRLDVRRIASPLPAPSQLPANHQLLKPVQANAAIAGSGIVPTQSIGLLVWRVRQGPQEIILGLQRRAWFSNRVQFLPRATHGSTDSARPLGPKYFRAHRRCGSECHRRPGHRRFPTLRPKNWGTSASCRVGLLK